MSQSFKEPRPAANSSDQKKEEVKPAESKPAEPAESKPEETVEVKLAETKPADAKPIEPTPDIENPANFKRPTDAPVLPRDSMSAPAPVIVKNQDPIEQEDNSLSSSPVQTRQVSAAPSINMTMRAAFEDEPLIMPGKTKTKPDGTLMEGGGDDEESEQKQDESDEEEKEFEVEHFYIDWRIVYLQAHLQNLFGKPKYQLKQEKSEEFLENENNIIIKSFYETDGFTTNLQSTKIISLIYDFYGGQIENMKSLKIIAESQFVDTKKVIKGLGTVYGMFCCLPFLIQLYLTNSVLVYLCMASMFIVQLILLSLEYLQCRQLTWKIYKQETWNFIELAQVCVFIIYMLVRIFQSN